MEWPDTAPDRDFLERIQAHPAMFVGSADSRGVALPNQQIIDEAMERYLNGVTKQIDVIMHSDGSLCVEEQLTLNEPSHIGALFRELLRATRVRRDPSWPPKRRASAYHPADYATANALSRALEVYVCDGREQHSLRYENGWPVKTGTSTKSVVKQTPIIGVRRLARPELGDWGTGFQSRMRNRLQTLSYLAPGCVLTLAVEEAGTCETYRSAEGLMEYVRLLAMGHEYEHEGIRASHQKNGIEGDLALLHVREDDSHVLGFVNHRLTRRRDHMSGFYSGLIAAFNDVPRSASNFNEPLRPSDVSEGLFAVVSVRMEGAPLKGPSRDVLESPEVFTFVQDLVRKAVSSGFDRQPEVWKQVHKRARGSAMMREVNRRVAARKAGGGGNAAGVADAR